MGQHLLEADYVRLFPAELFQNQGLAEAKIIRAVLPKIAADVKGYNFHVFSDSPGVYFLSKSHNKTKNGEY